MRPDLATDFTPVSTMFVRMSFSMMASRRSTPACPCVASA
jgi:hypothetical protein